MLQPIKESKMENQDRPIRHYVYTRKDNNKPVVLIHKEGDISKDPRLDLVDSLDAIMGMNDKLKKTNEQLEFMLRQHLVS